MQTSPNKTRQIPPPNKRCCSCTGNSDERCPFTRKAWLGSRYCGHHLKSKTGWVLSIATLIVTFIFGLLSDVSKAKITERYFTDHPEISISVNNQPLSQDAVLFDSATSTVPDLTITLINNNSKVSAKGLAIVLQVGKEARPYVHGEGWSYTEFTPPNANVAYLTTNIGLLPRKSGFTLKPITVDRQHLGNFAAGIQLRGENVLDPDARLHVFFETPAGTNRLVDDFAKVFLKSRFKDRYGEKKLISEMLVSPQKTNSVP